MFADSLLSETVKMNAMKKVQENLKSVLTRFGPLCSAVIIDRRYLNGQWKEAQVDLHAPGDAVPVLTVGAAAKGNG
nr:hypothetical protein [uncultured Desulfobulbus sp.]